MSEDNRPTKRNRCINTEWRTIIFDRKPLHRRLVQCGLARGHAGPCTWSRKPFARVDQ